MAKAWLEEHNGTEYVLFMCPGCKCGHQIVVGRWTWNRSLDAPTFSPSVLVTWEANPDAIKGFEEWRKARRCHSFVRDGNIQFLNDCTHELAGKTVALSEV